MLPCSLSFFLFSFLPLRGLVSFGALCARRAGFSSLLRSFSLPPAGKRRHARAVVFVIRVGNDPRRHTGRRAQQTRIAWVNKPPSSPPNRQARPNKRESRGVNKPPSSPPNRQARPNTRESRGVNKPPSSPPNRQARPNKRESHGGEHFTKQASAPNERESHGVNIPPNRQARPTNENRVGEQIAILTTKQASAPNKRESHGVNKSPSSPPNRQARPTNENRVG